jgi:hypothetical protein
MFREILFEIRHNMIILYDDGDGDGDGDGDNMMI